MKNNIIEHRLTMIETDVRWLKRMSWIIVGGIISIFTTIMLGGAK